MFTQAKAGGWAYGEILTSAQMNIVNDALPFALDCGAGGSYTPSGDITLTQPTTKRLTFNGSYFRSATDGGGLNVVGSNGLIAALANITTLNATHLSVGLGGDLTVDGSADFTALVTLSSVVDLSGVLIRSGAGRIPDKIHFFTDANASKGPADITHATVEAGVLTASRSLIIVDNANEGESFEVEMLETGQTLLIVNPALSTLLTMKNASGFANWARVRKLQSGSYAIVAKYVVP
jgi:hypothetical protein